MQVVLCKVDDPGAVETGDIGLPDVPFRRHLPIEHLGPAGDLLDLEGGVLLQDPKGLPDSVPGDASANRVQPLDQGEHVHGLGVPGVHGVHHACPGPKSVRSIPPGTTRDLQSRTFAATLGEVAVPLSWAASSRTTRVSPSVNAISSALTRRSAISFSKSCR